MTFRKYEKIHRLGKEEVEGILEGTVYLQEKIDGANTSIWADNSTIRLASRNQEITSGFNGFIDYIYDSPQGDGIRRLLCEYPDYRLYGEWLVKHTVQYNDIAYKHFYLFDIWDNQKEEYLEPLNVSHLAVSFGIEKPWMMDYINSPALEQIIEYVGKSAIGDRGEGVVIKNPHFTNRWGNKCHAKLVTNNFMEENALVFGGNNKHAENYNELYIIQKYLNRARVEKICNKIHSEIDEKLDLKHIPRITNTVFYDMITEEAWEIAKLNKIVDYKVLKNLAMKKSKLLYMELLDEGC